jgi:hypothetical protein
MKNRKYPRLGKGIVLFGCLPMTVLFVVIILISIFKSERPKPIKSVASSSAVRDYSYKETATADGLVLEFRVELSPSISDSALVRDSALVNSLATVAMRLAREIHGQRSGAYRAIAFTGVVDGGDRSGISATEDLIRIVFDQQSLAQADWVNLLPSEFLGIGKVRFLSPTGARAVKAYCEFLRSIPVLFCNKALSPSR